MRDEQILRLEEMDSRHWWTTTRLHLIYSSLSRLQLKMPIIFEIGAGSGGTLGFLKSQGCEVLALEPTEYGAAACRKLGIETINSTFENSIEWPNQVGCVLLLDVLEHIENDNLALESIYQKAKIGTFLVISVPADPKLWSKLDTDVLHFRRYTIKSLTQTVSSSGWDIVSMRYWMSLLKPLVQFRRSIMKGDFASETKMPNLIVNMILKIVVGFESKIPYLGRIPGTTIF